MRTDVLAKLESDAGCPADLLPLFHELEAFIHEALPGTNVELVYANHGDRVYYVHVSNPSYSTLAIFDVVIPRTARMERDHDITFSIVPNPRGAVTSSAART